MSLLSFLLLACVSLSYGLFVCFYSRKVVAMLQARVGPQTLLKQLQPLADVLKLSQKKGPFWGRPLDLFCFCVESYATYMTLAIVPLGSLLLLHETETACLLPFLACLIVGLSHLLLGLHQSRFACRIGAIQQSAQLLLGFFPGLMSLLTAVVAVGGYEWAHFSQKQGFFPWTWVLFSGPFYPIAGFIFIASGLMLLSLFPFDAPWKSPELASGILGEFSGKRLLLFWISHFYFFFLWSLMSVVLFLGAWTLPEVVQLFFKNSPHLLTALELVWILTKTFFLMMSLLCLAQAQPVIQTSQMIRFAWVFLCPLSLLALIGSLLLKG